MQNEETTPGQKKTGSKIIWKSQHINPQGKLTEAIQVELEAMNRQQAHDWVELLSYLASISGGNGTGGENIDVAVSAAAAATADSAPSDEHSRTEEEAPIQKVATASAIALALEKVDAAHDEVVLDSLQAYLVYLPTICEPQHHCSTTRFRRTRKSRTKRLRSPLN